MTVFINEYKLADAPTRIWEEDPLEGLIDSTDRDE